ncbi:hypothetical protein VNO80_30416 [Phaseolus coccineus]|uniref:1,3-beta-glucan synthase n=1 Tax=Phaseolus coccineus TaxID=3886 RepID=A0AAN9LG88_PHACN
MASTSGTKGPFEIGRQPSKRMMRAPTRNVDLGNEEGVVDSEIVPSSLAVLVPILRAALEIEEENPRVAYLCRFHAYEKAHTMDPTSSGRGVRQFKTYLLHKLEKEGELTERLVGRSDARELQTYYQHFYEKKIRDGEFSQRPEEMAKNVQIATVLYEVLKIIVAPPNIDEKTRRYAVDVEHKRGQYELYNSLPLYPVRVKPAIMELPEIKAAILALSKVDNLPMPIIRARPDASNDDYTTPTDRLKKVNDILDWIASVLGFQKGNVANQREHLILLLANLNIRDRVESSSQLHVETIAKLMRTIFKNYESWCHYVRCESNLRFLEGYDLQQIKLIYIALYLLIWGEASNIRFMPECICYIFHHMCHEVYTILGKNPSHVTESTELLEGRDDEYFLREVISPIYQVLMKEAKRNNKGKASHSNWRNYDDLNEYFWSKICFEDLKWPWYPKADFFRHSDQTQTRHRRHSQANTGVGKRKPKTNFVEVRTFLHLFRSFDRMWIFFILALQAMIIIGWSSLGPVGVFFDEDVFRNVMTIFITYAFLNFIQVTLDIILTWNALKNMKFTQLLRYFLKFVVATVWVVVLPICYSSSLVNPSGLIKFVTSWAGDWGNQSLYTCVVVLYMCPHIVATILFFLPPLRRKLERSNMRILTILMWWAQPKLYVGRGMHENMFSLLKYTLFWIMLLISKLAFSYYVEILPLIGPTKLIMGMSINNYQWHEFFPENETHNIGIVIAIWAPIILVYFMDTQIWYAIYATLFGGIIGAFSHLGEIRTLGMLWSRFQSFPVAFSQRFWTGRDRKTKQEESDETYERNNIAYFSQVWNEFISSMREEDLISNRDRDLLLVPYTASYVSVIQWPPFVLASKIPIAVDMAKDYKKETDDDLFRKIKSDGYMYSAVVECYKTLKEIILHLLLEEEDKLVVSSVCDKVEQCIRDETFVKEFNMSGLPSLSKKLEKFLTLLRAEDGQLKSQIVKVLQDIVEIIIQDVMVDGHLFLQTPQQYHLERGQRFVNVDTSFTHNRPVMEKVIRLHLLLTVKESAINVLQNIEARRRITFFANSLFMNMPKAPKVRDMLSFSVLTPYFEEDVLYSDEELNKENEDGISILFYLTKIYPVYGSQKRSKNPRDRSCYNNILNLMLTNPALRVAYIDETEETKDGKSQKVYYSVLVKGGDKYDEEIYRIKLPGPPTVIGEGKLENQNHAIVFTRGEALQTIDMNQDNYYEEAFKMRNVLEEFRKRRSGRQKPTILGIREHIFTRSASSLASFMSNQETSFVTIGQRILANPLRVQFHYGHPDIFDRIFHITRGGLSKASKVINLSEDILAGFNSTLRQGFITHIEYIQLGKGRDVGMNQISLFEAKVANENGEQSLSRDVYRLGQRFDFYRMLSFYFTTVGFYFSNVITVLTVYAFLHARFYMVLSGVEKEILQSPNIQHCKTLEEALATQSLVLLGLLLVLPMVMEIGLEKGFRTALGDVIIMQLQLASVFFTFQLGTKAHYYGRTLLHGGSKYRSIGHWKCWMGNRGGIGILADKSWESWWDEENEHMKHSNIMGKILEICLGLRFFMYQYGIVYHMDITHHHKELLVFGLSWAVLIIILIVLKFVSMARRRFGTYFQLMLRILKALLFLGFFAVMTVLFVVCGLTISDMFAVIIAFLPFGWAIILIAQACKVCLKGAKLRDSVKELSKAYEYVMGLIIFLPIAILSWLPFVSEFQTWLLFNRAFS